MSEKVIDEGQNGSGEGQKDYAKLMQEMEAKVKALESTNARLLEESQKTKEKYKQATSQVELSEREKLEKEGNYQALLENERKKREQIELENKEVKQKVLRSNIHSVIGRLAGEVHNLDDVLNQPSFSHILKKGINETDLTLSEDTAKEYLNELFTAKPYLKKSTQSTGVVNNKPNYQQGNGGIKPIEEMTTSEIESLLKEKFK